MPQSKNNRTTTADVRTTYFQRTNQFVARPPRKPQGIIIANIKTQIGKMTIGLKLEYSVDNGSSWWSE